jgi:hypothetical protein
MNNVRIPSMWTIGKDSRDSPSDPPPEVAPLSLSFLSWGVSPDLESMPGFGRRRRTKPPEVSTPRRPIGWTSHGGKSAAMPNTIRRLMSPHLEIWEIPVKLKHMEPFPIKSPSIQKKK